MESLDPVERVEKENHRLKETILRLEQENDSMAHELVTSKIELRNRLDLTEDQLESSLIAVERKSHECADLQEQCKALREEADQVKNMCRQEIARLEEEVRRTHSTIEQYKTICTDLGLSFEADKKRLEKQKKAVVVSNTVLSSLYFNSAGFKDRISGCKECSQTIAEWPIDSPPTRQIAGEDEATNHVENGSSPDGNTSVLQIVDLMDKLEKREEHISQMELELAQTKVYRRYYLRNMHHQNLLS